MSPNRPPAVALALCAAALAGCASAGGIPPLGKPLPAARDGAGADRAAADSGLEARLAREVSWPGILRGVLARSPGVRAARARWEGSLQKHAQALALPDPMVEFTKYQSDTGDPTTRSRFNTMVKQEIPFPAVLSLRGDAATKEAELARVRYDAALRDAVGEAREAFLEVLYIDRALEATAAGRGVLARYAAEAAGDLAAGRTKLPEEFRAQSLLAQSGYDLVVLRDLRRAAEQRLRGVLALPPSAPLGPLVPDATGPLTLSYEELLRLAETRSQEIAAAGIELEMAGIEERIASWEFAPTLTAGAEFMRNDMQEPALGTARNSRTVSLGFTIPFWFQGKTARAREAAAGTVAAGAERAATVEAVRAAVADLWVRASNTGRLVELYDGTLLPQAEKSARLAEALHREGKASLAGMLETETALQNFRLARARAEADHGQAVARLERVVGASVTAAPGEPAAAAPEGGDR